MPISNAIVPSGTPFTDLSAREQLSGDYLMLLADRDISILNHPALMGRTGQPGSAVVRVPHVGLGGYDKLASTTPGSEITATALASGHTDVTIATKAKSYAADDFAKFVIGDTFNTQLLAEDVAISVGRTLIGLIANVADDFGTQKGNTGQSLTWDDVLDAKAVLRNAGAVGQMLCVLHPSQWNQLEKDAGSLGFGFAMSLAGVINVGLGSYMGSYAGIDFYTSTEVPTANASADRAGALFVRGAVAWADVELPDEGDPNIVSMGRARLERARQGTYLATNYVTSYNVGVAKALDSAGVTMISKNSL